MVQRPGERTLNESEHYANVMRQLAIIRGQVQPRADEHELSLIFFDEKPMKRVLGQTR